MKRLSVIAMMIVLSLLVATSGAATAASSRQGLAAQATEAGTQAAQAPDQYGESYDVDAAVLKKAVGTSDGVPKIALAAFHRAALPVDQKTMDLAVKCWKDKICDTGTVRIGKLPRIGLRPLVYVYKCDACHQITSVEPEQRKDAPRHPTVSARPRL